MNSNWEKSIEISLAFRNIIRQKQRSLISLGAIIFGVCSLILASGFIEWIFIDFRETSIRSQLGHLQITRPGYQEEGKANPYHFLLPDTQPELKLTSSSLEKIKVIVPRLSFSGLISSGESTLSFIGEGVDPNEQNFFGDALQLTTGNYLSGNNTFQIIMGEGLSRNLGVETGDNVTLLVNTASGGINAIEVTISGLFTTVTKSYDDNAIRIPIETAQKLIRVTGAHSWIVLLNHTEDTNQVLSLLHDQLPQSKFEITPWYQLADFYNKTTVLLSKQVLAIKIIIAIIILLSISNTMSISVIERTGEIGTAMALGIKQTKILYMFLTEGILLGCIGGILGVMIGYLLANIISSVGIPMPPPPGMARGYIGEILVTQSMVLEAISLAIGTTLIASVYPAWKASKLQIVDALRHNR
ncbi:MAG TPA: FtsX-like permease family protein [Nitrosomonas sp.]|nr:FtsX-like permease family protein [Nitrosomonas sp.]HMW19868.1 FtsX-like permease family protein [Nitrosomonas sp.]HMW69931.1 FtsX-like permease family protein [Nitrosomonas sp.]HMY60617.1 FtsX-like permease family protein [Nitrosomonas sp.]HMY91244.1 FtsX-like permease family protein [Nitrosomonas sp.]